MAKGIATTMLPAVLAALASLNSAPMRVVDRGESDMQASPELPVEDDWCLPACAALDQVLADHAGKAVSQVRKSVRGRWPTRVHGKMQRSWHAFIPHSALTIITVNAGPHSLPLSHGRRSHKLVNDCRNGLDLPILHRRAGRAG